MSEFAQRNFCVQFDEVIMSHNGNPVNARIAHISVSQVVEPLGELQKGCKPCNSHRTYRIVTVIPEVAKLAVRYQSHASHTSCFCVCAPAVLHACSSSPAYVPHAVPACMFQQSCMCAPPLLHACPSSPACVLQHAARTHSKSVFSCYIKYYTFWFDIKGHWCSYILLEWHVCHLISATRPPSAGKVERWSWTWTNRSICVHSLSDNSSLSYIKLWISESHRLSSSSEKVFFSSFFLCCFKKNFSGISHKIKLIKDEVPSVIYRDMKSPWPASFLPCQMEIYLLICDLGDGGRVLVLSQ